MSHLTQLFSSVGGQFITPEADIIEKLKQIRAFVFDWDGVFTDASKDSAMQSRFNEADSMGTNLLRFSYYLNHKEIPVTAIISGEKNATAFKFVERECFHSSYSRFANKLEAADHLCEQHGISKNEIAYFFDDVLDLSLADQCGIRIFIQRPTSPLFNEFVQKHKLCDYTTAATCGQYAVREACELLIGLHGNFDKTITERMMFSEDYNEYLKQRKATTPLYYTTENNIVVPAII